MEDDGSDSSCDAVMLDSPPLGPDERLGGYGWYGTALRAKLELGSERATFLAPSAEAIARTTGGEFSGGASSGAEG
eukprot:12696967-Alexandrium_andersonii.AAC.1